MRAIVRSGGFLALAAVVGITAGSGVVRSRPASPEVEAYLRSDAQARPSVLRLARAAPSFAGGPVTAGDGESVNVYVSDSYPPEQVSPLTWANFFAGLPHGSELASLVVYVEPLAEVQATCGGGPDVLGCYGGGRLVIPGETADGVAPEEIARHEYGHHVAANRSNPPWRALDWGTKRWASYENVCARAAAGSVFPGDEGLNYRLDPGEAFAETYRVLSDMRAGAPGYGWPVVDGSFFPDAGALSAVEADVLQPWTQRAAPTIAGRFPARRAKPWTLPLALPLDGALSLTLRMPRGALDGLDLVAPDGRVLASGLWSGPSTKTLGFEVCGQRSLTVRVTPRGTPGRFSLEVAQP